VAAIAPWRFAAPLSPDLAAAREGRRIDFDALVGWCRREIDANAGLLLVEGIGGAMVPLDARRTVRDWIAALGIPALLVAGSHLGALSHTLSALAALREVGVAPVAIVVNESADSTVSLADTLASLGPHVGGVPLLVLRRDDAAGLARLADRLWAGDFSNP
jgi:dethiobiotin synthetase